MIQAELTRSSLQYLPLIPTTGVLMDHGSQNICSNDLRPKERAEPKQWDDEGAEEIDLRFEPGTHFRQTFMLIPRGSSRTFSDLGTNGDPSVFTQIRSHTSMLDIWMIMLRTRRLMSRPDRFTGTNVERYLRNVQERSLHACRCAEYESKTLQDGDHAIVQLQLGTCKLMSTGGCSSLLLVNANVIGMVRTARSTRQSLHATPHSLEEAYADLHILQGHSTVAQSSYLE